MLRHADSVALSVTFKPIKIPYFVTDPYEFRSTLLMHRNVGIACRLGPVAVAAYIWIFLVQPVLAVFAVPRLLAVTLTAQDLVGTVNNFISQLLWKHAPADLSCLQFPFVEFVGSYRAAVRVFDLDSLEREA